MSDPTFATPRPAGSNPTLVHAAPGPPAAPSPRLGPGTALAAALLLATAWGVSRSPSPPPSGNPGQDGTVTSPDGSRLAAFLDRVVHQPSVREVLEMPPNTTRQEALVVLENGRGTWREQLREEAVAESLAGIDAETLDPLMATPLSRLATLRRMLGPCRYEEPDPSVPDDLGPLLDRLLPRIATAIRYPELDGGNGPDPLAVRRGYRHALARGGRDWLPIRTWEHVPASPDYARHLDLCNERSPNRCRLFGLRTSSWFDLPYGNPKTTGGASDIFSDSFGAVDREIDTRIVLPVPDTRGGPLVLALRIWSWDDDRSAEIRLEAGSGATSTLVSLVFPRSPPKAQGEPDAPRIGMLVLVPSRLVPRPLAQITLQARGIQALGNATRDVAVDEVYQQISGPLPEALADSAAARSESRAQPDQG